MHEAVGFELSAQQERAWASCPAGPVLRAQSVLGLTGHVDASSLHGAVQRAIARHEILRTTFLRPPGRRVPLQVVQDDPAVDWQTVSLEGVDALDQQRRVDELRRGAEHRKGDYERGPLIDALLVSIEADRHLLILTAPAVIADGETLVLLAREAVHSLAGRGAADEEPLQYADYAAWQRELLEDAAAEGTRYWESLALEEAPRTLLPLADAPDVETPATPEPLPLASPDDLAAAVDRLAIAPATPQDVWLTAWSAVVARLTGLSAVVIEVAVGGRTQDEVSSALGPFARSLPVRCDVSREVAFAAAVGRVASARLEAERHQDHAPPGDTAGRPVSLVGFAFQPERPREAIGDLHMEVLAAHAHSVALQVKLECGGADPAATLWFDPQAVGADEAGRVARHLEQLVRSAAAEPGRELGALDVLPAEDRGRILSELSRSERREPGAACAHWLFEECAERHPERAALTMGDEAWTYAQVNARANQLAHVLRRRGVRPDVPVAVCMDRSPELIVCLLGILKAGGAYLPLHPDHPRARLAFQLEDTGASIVLTRESLLVQLPQFAGEILCVDRDSATFDAEPDSNPDRVGGGEDLAYLIYTSGSTGVPKGVAVRHAGLGNYVTFLARELGIDRDARPLRFGLVTTVSTDLGNTSVFGALTTGGCLDLVPVEAAMDGDAFGAYVEAHPLDVLKITPSHMAALLAGGEARVLPRRRLVLGGEAASWDLVDRVGALGDCAITNHYGPTETTVGSLVHDVRASDASHRRARTVPIGRPIDNTEIFVLDEHRRPVPLGAPGELHIGGAGLARGYWNQPEQTAERFVAHPFGPDDGSRLYRTGDRVRFLGDGTVEFLERIDGQVKIRGFRVETGEIEAVLQQHPGVAQAAAVLREDRPGDARLVAYVVPTLRAPAEVKDVRSVAQEHLPDYMVPSAFLVIPALPLTPSGKLDRAALPSPDDVADSARSYVAPRDPAEEQIAAIWADALGVERVSVEDDFFELGGHSLLATQVIARIRNAFGVQLPLHSLFTSPSVAGLAALVTENREATAEDDSELARMLEELEGLSDEEAERLLATESSQDREA